jgi:hypothetical protein
VISNTSQGALLRVFGKVLTKYETYFEAEGGLLENLI